MSGTTELVVAGAIGFGISAIGFARERRKEQEEKQKNG
jgi:hypothetical protein